MNGIKEGRFTRARMLLRHTNQALEELVTQLRNRTAADKLSKLKTGNTPQVNILSKKRALAVLLLTVLVISSCVYYNTFYNAEKYFESAQDIAVPETGRPPARAIQNYDKVIERCTYILQEHPNSRWAEPALYLLSRSLYYKQQNVLQAKERFQDILRVFPDSKFVPESIIYIAKIEYQINNFEEAYRRLQQIIEEEQYSGYHSRVLLLRSEWYLKEGNIEQAQNDLNNIISDYPRSDEFEKAYLNLGTSYLEEEEYQQAEELFTSLIRSRVSRRIRFNARYYLALSNFYLKNHDLVLEQLQQLIRDEYEQSVFPKLYLLQARTFAALTRYDRAESLFAGIITDNRRTSVAAEANYYLAEMYFLQLGKYEEALKHYNAVSAELRTSPYVERAMGRSSVVSQLIQLNRADIAITPQKLIEEQFKLAEYYLYVMNLPDSALSVYESIEKQELKLIEKKDSLEIAISEAEAKADSLEKNADNLDLDTTVTENEYLDFTENESDTTPDSLDIELTAPELDELMDPEQQEIAFEEEPIDTLALRIESLKENRDNLRDAVELFRTEFIPYSKFLSAWVWLKELDNKEQAEAIYEQMLINYPDNRYVYATEQLLAGKTVVLRHPQEVEMEQLYEEAEKVKETDREQGIEKLKELYEELITRLENAPPSIHSKLDELLQKTAFSIGYGYYFDLSDSTAAKDYFDKLMQDHPQSEYTDFIRKFYQDGQFIVMDSLVVERERTSEDIEDGIGGDTEIDREIEGNQEIDESRVEHLRRRAEEQEPETDFDDVEGFE